MINQKQVGIKLVKTRSLSLIRCWLIGLCTLLVRLHWVAASGITVETRVVSIGLDAANVIGLPDSNKMVENMKLIGFSFDNENTRVVARPNDPDQPEELEVDANRAPHVASYVVEVALNSNIYFALPEYSDVGAATAALELLRTIAVIKLFWGKCAYVTYTTSNLDCHQINMQILSRVVNLFDCTTLELCLKPDLVSYNRELDLGACRDEAQKTIDRAIYKSQCQLRFSSNRSLGLPALIDRGIVLLRPILGVFLVDNEVHDAPLLYHLPLVDGYSIYLLDIPSDINIDLGVLQTSAAKCSYITLETSSEAKLTLTGLENAVDKHTGLVLEADWDILTYLCNNNEAQIRVHTLLGVDVQPQTIQPMLDADQKEAPTEPKIIATTAKTLISADVPCKSMDYYKQIYTREAYAKFGIMVETINIAYEDNRTDLFETLDTLRGINALKRIPESIWLGDVQCYGKDLDGPDWKLQETVSIRLNHASLDHSLTNYTEHQHMCFCQHINYKTLEIKGGRVPCENQIGSCIRLLNAFRSITAQKLKISNARDNDQTPINFVMDKLKTPTTNHPKWPLYVGTLVLDNVDESIVYWVLQRYIFSESMHLHLLNLHFSNLAVAQILSLPEAQNITMLVVNGFPELDEVKYFNQQDKITTFSLFKYIEEEVAKDTPIESLGLHKLCLQLADANTSLYSDVLDALGVYSILPLAMSFGHYTKWTSTKHATNPIHRAKFTLSGTTIEALKTDLAKYGIKGSFQLNTSQSEHSQQSQAPSNQRQSVVELLLQFSDTFFLTDTDFVTIVRWVACHFKDVATIWLANVKVSDEERAVITSRNYLFKDLDMLNRILVERAAPDEPPLNLLTRLHRIILVAGVSNPVHAIVTMQPTLLTQFICHQEELNNHIPSYPNTETSIRKIINYIMHQQPPYECAVCLEALDGLKVEPKEQDQEDGNDNDDEPPTKKPRPSMGSESQDENPQGHPVMICYFKCGHPLHSKCAIGVMNMQNNNCPTCRQPVVYKNAHQLMSVPLTTLVFAEDSISNVTVDREWLRTMSCWSEQVLLYVAYRDRSDFATTISSEIVYDHTRPIHII
ncbi:hypothetical protein NEHOM01_0120 [Nematocida homosporus]|uniref:uncharacterized protein n=1 Tax=Nematocida homosporus TaxID=1912981 RepID=UPI002220CBC2|nr:uncharacterized protein NEHOM01_0120 [Nematocida homosporus]KAI5184375.1 hypothetical protein NEHOM01_0120 [Nematocida homosporus]